MTRAAVLGAALRAVHGICLVLFAVFCGVAHAQMVASEILFTVSRDGDFVVVDARVDLPVSPAMAWSVLTDYEKYPSFISTMRESKIVSRGPDGLVVDQKGSFGFLFFTQDIEVRMLIFETFPSVIEARSLSGSFRDIRGRYDLQSLGNGVRLQYSGRLLPEFRLPPIVGISVVHYVMQKNFTEMVDEILRRDTVARRPAKIGE